MYVPSQSVFMIYWRVRWHISHIFVVARSRFLAGVAITNISMQLALLYSELDYLTYNPTNRHGTGYTFTWPQPTVEPVWLGTNFNEILIEIHINSFKKIHLKMSSGKWRPSYLGLNMLNTSYRKRRTCFSYIVNSHGIDLVMPINIVRFQYQKD